MSIKIDLKKALHQQKTKYDVSGIVTDQGKVYSLGSDTKVLSTIFELFARPIINQVASKYGYIVEEPVAQNHYPDFTLYKNKSDKNKIAIDIKTTYIKNPNDKFNFTLGGYTSFIRNNTKNIVYPFDQYSEHWVIGYVYTRVALQKASSEIYDISEVETIPRPYKDVFVFLQDKWRIAGDVAGSGNTTNIGSIKGNIKDFEEGNTPFKSESEFLSYWRNYERTKELRDNKYKNIEEYRVWISKK